MDVEGAIAREEPTATEIVVVPEPKVRSAAVRRLAEAEGRKPVGKRRRSQGRRVRLTKGGNRDLALQAYNYLRAKHGLSEQAAAAVVGHLWVESAGFDPAVLRGEWCGDGGAACFVQQLVGDRQTKFRRWARHSGRKVTDLAAQLDFIFHEAEGGDKGAVRAVALLREARTVDDATRAFGHYERAAGYTPSNPGGLHSYGQRRAAADMVLRLARADKVRKPYLASV